MKRMHAEKMKILLISVLALMLLPFAAFGEYSISHSYGSMAPTRIRELLRHDECFYAIVDEPQGLFGNHVFAHALNTHRLSLCASLLRKIPVFSSLKDSDCMKQIRSNMCMGITMPEMIGEPCMKSGTIVCAPK